MKILYIITGLGQGGAERVVCDLADAMCAKGHTVKIAYLTGSVLTKPKSDTIELIPINLTGIKGLPSAYFKISQVIRSYRPDVVHSHMVHANILTRLVKLSVPIKKLISTAHNSNEGGSFRMMCYRATHHLSDLTTNVSRTAVQEFERKHAVPAGEMRAVYNGIDFEYFRYEQSAKNEVLQELSLDSTYKVILAVGRFNSQKNYPNLLHSMKILKDKTTVPFKLLIVGDGELRDEIEKQISNLGLNHDVVLLGRRSDIPRLMSACDVFTLSSDYEGLPTVLIEALACKSQIASTDAIGVREVVANFAEIVPIRQPQLLAEAIELKLNNSSQNIAGFEHAKKHFDLEAITEQWISIYNEK